MHRQAARLAAMAALARPVQHDINNLLTVVFANLEMLKRSAAEGAPQRQLDRIHEAARRFQASTRSLLVLLRRPAGEPAPVRLSQAVEELRPLLGLLLPAPGLLVVECPDQDPAILLDRAGFEEALLALAQQAAEAPPRGAGLNIAIRPRPDGGVECALRCPALPAILGLVHLTEAAGGRAELADDLLTLVFPPHGAVVAAA